MKALPFLCTERCHGRTIAEYSYADGSVDRPHLPWHMPREFWDMYPPTEEIELPKHQESPTNMPPIAFTYSFRDILRLAHLLHLLPFVAVLSSNVVSRYECDGQTQLVAFNESVPIPFPKGVMNGSTHAGAGRGCTDAECVPPPNVTKSLRKGYYASVTYTDHLVGMLLDKLVALKHENDTVVGLIGE